MKIERDEKIYLQESDVVFIYRKSIKCPSSFLKEVLDNEESVAIYDDKRGGVDFVYCFSDQESTKWINSQEYLLDYDELSEKTPEEIEKMISKNAKKIILAIKKFSNLAEEDREAYINEHNFKISKLSYIIGSLMTLKEHIEGRLEFLFPAEICDYDDEWFWCHYGKDAS